MSKVFTIAAVTMLLCAATAQQAPTGAAPDAGPNPPAPSAPLSRPEPERPTTSKELAAALKSPAFSARVAQAALDRLLQGFQDNNPVRVMSVFDRDKLADYAGLDERVHSLMQEYEGFRGFFHVQTASEQNGRGEAVADFQFEKVPFDGANAPQRRNGQVRIELERGPKEWKIVRFEPRGFFTE